MSGNNSDYYATLGVSKSASDDEIRKAFKRMARESHPDHNPEDPQAEERFKRVNEAWQVLSDPAKRKTYDRYGAAGLRDGFDPNMYEQSGRGFGSGGFGGGGFGGFGGGFEDFSFEDFFGGGRSQRQRRAPAEKVLPLSLTFDEALHGATRHVTVSRKRPCSACGGSGMLASSTCGVCRGSGSLVEDQSVEVRIPQGAATGDRIRLKGKGDLGAGGRAGDVILQLNVEESPRFKREDLNLVATASVSALDLILGTTIEVEGPWGHLKMKLTENFDPRRRLRAAGRGMRRGDKHGDLLVEIRVLPLNLTQAQRDVLLEIRTELENS